MIYIIKQEGLYQNKVNSSLVFTGNCKWAMISVVFTLLEGNEYCIHIGGIFKNFFPQRVCVAVLV